MRRIILLSSLLLAFSAGSLTAQADGPAASPEAEIVAPSDFGSASAAGSGLPQAPPPPRTLRAYWHLFGAYAIVWVLLFGYAISLGRRSGALERRIERLEGGGA